MTPVRVRGPLEFLPPHRPILGCYHLRSLRPESGRQDQPEEEAERRYLRASLNWKPMNSDFGNSTLRPLETRQVARAAALLYEEIQTRGRNLVSF